jgi:20S proteasome subunit alpha 3
MASLKSDYKADLTLDAAVTLSLKTLTKAMDTTAQSSEKVEVAILTRDPVSGVLVQKALTPAEIDAVLLAIKASAPPAEAPRPTTA